MKLKITEEQLRFIIENENQNIIEIYINEIYGDDSVKILSSLRLCKKHNCDGIKIIGDFNFPDYHDNFNSLQKLCDMIVEIDGDLKMWRSSIKSFKNLKKVKYLRLQRSNIISLPKLKNAEFIGLSYTDVKSLPQITNANMIDLGYSNIESLPKLTNVNNLILNDTPIKILPKLTNVNENLNLNNSLIQELSELTTVGYDLMLSNSEIQSLPKLTNVGGILNLSYTPLGKKLKKTMSEDEIKNKFGVKGELDI